MTLKAWGNREMMECWKHFGKFARQGARSRVICMSAAAHDTPGNTTTAAASTCIFQIGKIDLLLWSNTMIDLAYYYNTGGSGLSCAFWSSWSSLADPDHQLRVDGCSSLILILILIFLCILIIDCGLQLPDPDPDHQFPAPILLRRHHIFSHAGTLLPLVGSFNQSIQGLTCHSFHASPSLNHCRYAAALVKILQPSRKFNFGIFWTFAYWEEKNCCNNLFNLWHNWFPAKCTQNREIFDKRKVANVSKLETVSEKVREGQGIVHKEIRAGEGL